MNICLQMGLMVSMDKRAHSLADNLKEKQHSFCLNSINSSISFGLTAVCSSMYVQMKFNKDDSSPAHVSLYTPLHTI